MLFAVRIFVWVNRIKNFPFTGESFSFFLGGRRVRVVHVLSLWAKPRIFFAWVYFNFGHVWVVKPDALLMLMLIKAAMVKKRAEVLWNEIILCPKTLLLLRRQTFLYALEKISYSQLTFHDMISFWNWRPWRRANIIWVNLAWKIAPEFSRIRGEKQAAASWIENFKVFRKMFWQAKLYMWKLSHMLLMLNNFSHPQKRIENFAEKHLSKNVLQLLMKRRGKVFRVERISLRRSFGKLEISHCSLLHRTHEREANLLAHEGEEKYFLILTSEGGGSRKSDERWRIYFDFVLSATKSSMGNFHRFFILFYHLMDSRGVNTQIYRCGGGFFFAWKIVNATMWSENKLWIWYLARKKFILTFVVQLCEVDSFAQAVSDGKKEGIPPAD